MFVVQKSTRQFQIVRTCFLPSGLGSSNRVLFTLPDESKAELYVTFEHSLYGGPQHSEWSNATMGLISGSAVHCDEIFGVLSGKERDPDAGIALFNDMLIPHIESDFSDWRIYRDDLEMEAVAELAENTQFYRAQRLGKI